MPKLYVLTALAPLNVSAHVYIDGHHETKDRQNEVVRVPARKTEIQHHSMDAGDTLEVSLVDELTPDGGMPIFAVEHPKTVGETKGRDGVYQLKRISD